MIPLEAKLAALNQKIAEAKNIVFFTGAGVSTDSGLQDFRSIEGLYNKPDINFAQYQPEYLLSRTCLMEDTKVFFEFYRQKLDCRNAKPNITHIKMAELENAGKNVSVITQNIDALHQKAGSSRVIEIHGDPHQSFCEECFCAFEDPALIFDSQSMIPKCPKCGGLLRPNVVLYGEALPGVAWEEANIAINDADLVIACGTSLTVYPAARLLDHIPQRKFVIINRDQTSYDQYASIVIHAELNDVFSKINSKFEE